MKEIKTDMKEMRIDIKDLQQGQKEIKSQIDDLIIKPIGEEGMITIMLQEQKLIKEELHDIKCEVSKLRIKVKQVDVKVAKNSDKLLRIVK